MYILVKNMMYFKCDDLLDVASHFKITISPKGIITCDGVECTISYNIKEWTL